MTNNTVKILDATDALFDATKGTSMEGILAAQGKLSALLDTPFTCRGVPPETLDAAVRQNAQATRSLEALQRKHMQASPTALPDRSPHTSDPAAHIMTLCMLAMQALLAASVPQRPPRPPAPAKSATSPLETVSASPLQSASAPSELNRPHGPSGSSNKEIPHA